MLRAMADSSEPPRKLRVDPRDVLSLARWLQTRPFNRDGTDKTYVLKCLHNLRQFALAARTAKRVERDG